MPKQADDGRKRAVIESVSPEIDGGRYPVKRVAGDRVRVRADIFCDGHDLLCARLWHRKNGESDWQRFSMQPMINDIWEGWFTVTELGFYEYTVSAWVDHFRTWQTDLQKKFAAGQDVRIEFSVGLHMMQKALEQAREGDAQRLGDLLQSLQEEKDESLAVGLACSPELGLLMEDYQERGLVSKYPRILQVEVDRKKAGCSAWYEIFPRSWGYTPGEHGTFKECERVLPDIAEMGFDVLYLPPIHPIGRTKRKGKNNSPVSEPGDPGSPWAIGSEEGGHKAVHPELGRLDDFREFLSKAREHGLEIALDLAFQCSNDHPYLREHPQWFRWRPDGSVQFAENPPKKYEDIVPLDFETEDWPALWQELKSVVVFWIEQGVSIFRVDNPHTKPFAFWEWLIGEVKNEHPEVIFLSEAFTRPKVMNRLAKLGFTQSYTYFAWRNSRQELRQYMEELTKTGPADFFRPNFWPNTPDILPEILQYGGRPAFVIRLALAATLSSNYGIYGPAYELCVADPVPGKEEYLNSEKYEIKDWKWDQAGNLKDFIARMNNIRRENPALQATNNLEFQECDNPNILVYSKYDEESSNYLLIAVNLDPFHNQAGWIRVPLEQLGIAKGKPYLLMDLVGDEKHVWTEEWNRIELNPHISPVQVFHIHAHLRTENDFDYFM